MSRLAHGIAVIIVLMLGGCASVIEVPGNQFPLHSQGDQTASDYLLGLGYNGQTNGYVGTYFQVQNNPTTVHFVVRAQSISRGAVVPHMTVSVADFKQSFDVTSKTAENYYCSCVLHGGSLAAGGTATYFVRIQLDNFYPPAAPVMSISSLIISGSNIKAVTTPTADQTARTAANTYIQFYRQGERRIRVVDCNTKLPLPAGTQVKLTLMQNEFNFGAAVFGTTRADAAWINVDASGNYTPPAGPGNAMSFQQNLLANFNMIVPSNAGKWVHEIKSGHENDPAAVTDVSLTDMSLIDGMIQFAKRNNLRMRMHNLIWGPNVTSNKQQPQFAVNLLNQGTAGVASLQTAIYTRINYYLGAFGNRSKNYLEVDGLNESLHQPSYWNLLGTGGIANIYSLMNSEISAVGASTRTYLNEYNVLQFSSSLDSMGKNISPDPYANWYRQNVDDIHGAVSGVGMQLYPNNTNPISPAEMQESLQNLSVPGLPMSLTEFGVMLYSPKPALDAGDYAIAAGDLTDALTMIYGTPQCTSFLIWTFGGPNDFKNPPTKGSFSTPVPISSLFDANWNITTVGTAYQNWMANYKTDVTVTLDANGTASFTGTYGTYKAVISRNGLIPSTTILTISKSDPGPIQVCYRPNFVSSNP
jgi:GH35 family endo-1,4-beta-xylanase